MAPPPVDMGAYEALVGSDPRTTMYVDQAAGLTDGCGASWTDAFDELDKALAVAGSSNGVVEEIWVAQGTYKPTAESTDPKSPPTAPRPSNSRTGSRFSGASHPPTAAWWVAVTGRRARETCPCTRRC